MMFSKMDKKTAGAVREILENELPAILEKHGLKFEMGNGSFDSDSVKFNNFRIALANAKSQEEKELDRELAWREEAVHIGYGDNAPKKLDKTKIATINGDKFALYGFRPKAKKQPWIILNLKTKSQHICDDKVAEKFWGVA